MDATRPRRLRDSARQEWYARWRCFRLARHLGFPSTTAVAPTPEARPASACCGIRVACHHENAQPPSSGGRECGGLVTPLPCAADGGAGKRA
jgi:hypothetical protein